MYLVEVGSKKEWERGRWLTAGGAVLVFTVRGCQVWWRPGVQPCCGLRVSLSRHVGPYLVIVVLGTLSGGVFCVFVAVVLEPGGLGSVGVWVAQTRPGGLIDAASWAAFACSGSGMRERWTAGLSMAVGR